MRRFTKSFVTLILFTTFIAAQNNWEWQHPLPQGNSLTYIQTFGQDSILSIGHMGTQIKSTNSGSNWQMNFDNVGLHFFFDVHFINPNIGWSVGDSGRVHKTTDGGLTWNAYEVNDSTLYSHYSDVFFIDEMTGWVAGNSDNISKTTDGGVTWTHYPITGLINTIYFINDLVGWATSSSSTIYYTFDGGLNWYVQPGVSYGTMNDIYFLNDSLGWAVGSFEHIIRTRDGGNNWIEVQDFVDWYNLNQVYFWDENNGIAVGDYGKMLRSTDGGVSWSYIDAGTKADFKSISTNDDSNLWVVGRSGIILHSTDAGLTWNEVSEMATYNIVHKIQFVDENNGWAAGANIIRSTDGGATWTNLDTLKHSIWAFHAIDAQTCFFIESQLGYFFKTTDGGATFDTLQSPGGIPPLNIMQFIDANTGWVLDAVDSVYRTTNGGLSWSVTSLDDSSDFFGNDLFFIDSNNGWVVGSNGYILHTSDGGANWTIQNSGVTDALNQVKFIDANTGWIGGYQTLLHTTDGGATWNNLSTSATPIIYNLMITDNNTIWALGVDALYSSYTKAWFSTDGGNTFQAEDIPTPYANDMFFLNSQVGWITTTQGGILKRTGTANSVNNSATKKTPSGFSLQQNYPNPFNPTTNIPFKLLKPGLVNLSIYDIAGRKIKTLVNEKLPAGEYLHQWDGTNDNNKAVASGMYIYRMQISNDNSNNLTQYKKLVLMR